MKSAILNKGETFYTHLGSIFHAIEGRQRDYNWLITHCECYPSVKAHEALFANEFVWISGEQLTEIINREDFQFVWGVLSGFNKEIELEEVLKYQLPFADENTDLWIAKPHIQHPLAAVEIVAFDSSATLVISKDDNLVDKFRQAFPLAVDLVEYNTECALQS